MTASRPWLTREAPVALVLLLPALLLAWCVHRFILVHFFWRAPYLLDSGMLSGIIYRSGPLLTPPEISCSYATSFYQVYFSPIISVLAGLSYLLPVQRIEWFAIVEALVFFPIGAAVYAVARRLEPDTLRRRLPITLLAALAFSFSGLVLWMVGYPHYEAATAGLIMLMLTAVVTGRRRAAWVFLVLAASVRQDGGVHAALALLPLLYLKWRGTAMPPSVRALRAIVAGAVGLSVLGFVLQRLFFVPADRLHAVYLGTPAYAHLSVAMLGDRLRSLLAHCQVLTYPFLACVLVASLRRDAGYLLGWAVTLPWFVFNFTAVDGQKSSFLAYSIHPFLVAVFWIYLYGALLAPPPRRLRAGVLEAVLALVSAASTLGMHRADPGDTRAILTDMTVTPRGHADAVHAFVAMVGKHRGELGRLYADSAVAALALEWLSLANTWQPGTAPADTIMFHTDAPDTGPRTLRDLFANQLDSCTRIVGTRIYVCTHAPLPDTIREGIVTGELPSMFVFTKLPRESAQMLAHGLSLRGEASLTGALGPLAAGAYSIQLALAPDPQRADGQLALEVRQADTVLGRASNRGDVLDLSFAVPPGDQELTYQLVSRATAPITIRAAQVRRTGEPAR